MSFENCFKYNVKYFPCQKMDEIFVEYRIWLIGIKGFKNPEMSILKKKAFAAVAYFCA